VDKEMMFFLKQGPITAKELARVTGKSTSTIYKALGGEPDVIKTTSPEGGNLFSLPAAQELEQSVPAAAPVSPAQAATTSSAPGKRGRKPTAAGLKLTAVSADNPRRKNSHGYRSLQIVIDNPGLATEEFLAKGGRLNDLRWDIAHGSVRAE
jgi:hypothetical protein